MGVRARVTTMALDPPARFRELIRSVEDGGFDALWVADSSLHARDVYVSLATVAVESRRLRFCPSGTHPYTRRPAVSLNALATLDELSGGAGDGGRRGGGPAELWVRRIGELLALGVQHVNIFLLSRDRLGMVRDLAQKVLPRVRRG